MTNVDARGEVEPSLCFLDPLFPVCAVHVDLLPSSRGLGHTCQSNTQWPFDRWNGPREHWHYDIHLCFPHFFLRYLLFLLLQNQLSTRGRTSQVIDSRPQSGRGGGAQNLPCNFVPLVLPLSWWRRWCIEKTGADFKPLLCTVKYPISLRSPTPGWKSAESHTPDLPSAESRQREIFVIPGNLTTRFRASKSVSAGRLDRTASVKFHRLVSICPSKSSECRCDPIRARAGRCGGRGGGRREWEEQRGVKDTGIERNESGEEHRRVFRFQTDSSRSFIIRGKRYALEASTHLPAEGGKRHILLSKNTLCQVPSDPVVSGSKVGS